MAEETSNTMIFPLKTERMVRALVFYMTIQVRVQLKLRVFSVKSCLIRTKIATLGLHIGQSTYQIRLLHSTS